MDKRNFLRLLGRGAVMTTAAATVPFSFMQANAAQLPFISPVIYPPLLKVGDTIGIICPSGAIDEQLSFMLIEETIQALGFKAKWGKHVHDRYGHLAGTDDARLADLHMMFADHDVKAIICMRGGSGAARLLDRIDYNLIKRNPKIFLGYSDITALHLAIHSQTKLITFHGAVGISSWTTDLADQFKHLFLEGGSMVYTNPIDKGDQIVATQNRIQTITSGTTEGRLIGGNLTVLTSIMGSNYFPDFTDSILFLEEVGEEPYRIERMFCQLRLAGVLSKIKGFIFGQCVNCTPNAGYGSLSLDDVLADYIRPLHIPAYQGAMIGHIKNQFILPIGLKIKMDASAGTLVAVEEVFS